MIKKMELAWIMVSDINQAKQFFSNSVGLKLAEEDTQFGWLEFEGSNGGARLGVGQYNPEYSQKNEKPGMNAVMAMNVDDIVKAKQAMETKGVKFVGDIMEVPGHVKLATFVDADGNMFQLCQVLNK